MRRSSPTSPRGICLPRFVPVSDGCGDDTVPLFTLGDSPPLASLIATWRAVSEELPALPLLRLSQDTGLHPNVRFLLLAHAAESLHARTVEDEDRAEYERRKDSFKKALAAIKDAGLTEEHRFLRDNAEPRRPYPLSQRLRSTVYRALERAQARTTA